MPLATKKKTVRRRTTKTVKGAWECPGPHGLVLPLPQSSLTLQKSCGRSHRFFFLSGFFLSFTLFSFLALVTLVAVVGSFQGRSY